MASVTIIIVTHNSAAVIADCLLSIPKEAAITVVDNASTDNTLAIVRDVAAQAVVISNTENLGFGCANNQALEKVETPFALLLNPDARLQQGSLEALFNAADRYGDAAIIAPSIVDERGNWRQSCKDTILKPRQPNPLGLAGTRPEGDICTSFLSGAALLLRMQYFQTIGFFDPNIFMFYEDDDLCIRVKRAGYSLVLAQDAAVTHFMGRSSPATNYYLWKKNWHLAHSRVYIEEKYKGHVAAIVVAIISCCQYTVKGLFHSLLMNKPKAVRSWARGFGSIGIMKKLYG